MQGISMLSTPFSVVITPQRCTGRVTGFASGSKMGQKMTFSKLVPGSLGVLKQVV